ncbi:hypothetical protein EG329_012845 [Mollisiaceae sp. DMI_Dod_QoI]|nr:hypothetical protein EG329_012845 [Helotiales sp. DMI_Dod_QoI]
MRLHFSTTLFVASSLLCLGSSLPFFPRKAALEPRATYSVVPVDGGSAAPTNTAGQGEVTIVKTVVETPTPATQTIIETDTLPPTTDIIISTQTVAGPETTQTVDITLTPVATPTTVTATEYSVIDISTPTTIVLPPTATTSQTSTKSSELAAPPNTSTNTAPTISVPKTTISSTTADLSLSATASASSTAKNSNTSSITTSIPLASASTASYDNGQWHTTYPTWSNGTATLRTAATSVQTAPPFPTELEGRMVEDLQALETLSQFFRRSFAGLKRAFL